MQRSTHWSQSAGLSASPPTSPDQLVRPPVHLPVLVRWSTCRSTHRSQSAGLLTSPSPLVRPTGPGLLVHPLDLPPVLVRWSAPLVQVRWSTRWSWSWSTQDWTLLLLHQLPTTPFKSFFMPVWTLMSSPHQPRSLFRSKRRCFGVQLSSRQSQPGWWFWTFSTGQNLWFAAL